MHPDDIRAEYGVEILADLEWSRWVEKHWHSNAMNRSVVVCDRPWAAVCQADHWHQRDNEPPPYNEVHRGSICWAKDYRTWEEAVQGIRLHLAEGDCDSERDLHEDQIWPKCKSGGRLG